MTSLAMPYTFVPDTTILSGEVNGNFAAVVSWSTNITDANIKALANINPNKLNLALSFPVLRASGLTCFSAGNTGDSNPRWLVDSDGFMKMGPGGATAADVLIKRAAASTISIRNSADTAFGTVGASTYNSYVAASDTVAGTQLISTGIKFGPGGASAFDTLLRRAGSNALVLRNGIDTTDGNLTVGALGVSSTLGVTGTASFSDDLLLGLGTNIQWRDQTDTATASIRLPSLASGLTLNIPDVGATTAYVMQEPSTVTPGAGKIFYSDGTRGKMLEATAGSSTTLLHGGTTPSFSALVAADVTSGTLTPTQLNIFTSSDQTITAAGALTIAHSLARVPKFLLAYLVCQSSENGYTTGDVIAVQIGAESTSTTDSRGVSVTIDATNLVCRFGSAAASFTQLNGTTGASVAITNANWKIRFVAF